VPANYQSEYMSESLEGFISSVTKLEKIQKNNTHLIKTTNIATLIINTRLHIYQLQNVNTGIYVVPGHSRT
jgi:endo-1,4-beta-mannosidase